MYATLVIAARQRRLETQFAATLPPAGLIRHPVATCRGMTATLAPLWDRDDQVQSRPFSQDEEAFVVNEQLLCKIDYRYAAERYLFINKAGQTLEPLFPLWESQELLLAELARQEETRWRTKHPDGLLGNCLKGRQLGCSTWVQSLLAQRVLTHGQVRALIASDVPQNSGSEGLFGMLELMVEHWPWWLKPKERFHTKNKHIMWENSSRVLVESGKSMKGGLMEDGGEKGQLGRSKSQPLDELLLTPTGWVAMGDIGVGDYVIGRSGQPTRVKGVYPQGVEPVYRVTFSDGTWTRCSGDHLWTVQTDYMKWDKNRWRTQPLRELMTNLRLKCGWNGHRYFIPVLSAPAALNVTGVLPIPAYALGLLLGDGGLTTHVGFSTTDAELLQGLTRELPAELSISHRVKCDYAVVVRPGQPNPWTRALRQLKLLGKKSTDKHIPWDYMTAAPADRIALLQGLLDTDGWSTKDGRVLFGTSSLQLAEDVRELVALLGGTASLNGYATPRAKAYRLQIALPPAMLPFRLSRKLARLRKRQRGVYRAITKVELEGDAATQCIAVEAADQLYVTRFGIVTHNTFSLAHLSEITTWERPEQINSSLLPAIPRTPRTLCLRESTSMGRNNYWHREWNLAASGDDPRFFNIFIPWYAEKSQYWLPCPPDWIPSDDTLAFARRTSEVGPLYMHRPVSLAKEQLYWYELHKRAAIKREELYKFLSEYPAEPEEAFQNSGRSIFSIETLTRITQQARPLADLWRVAPRAELLADKEASLEEYRMSQSQLARSQSEGVLRASARVVGEGTPQIVREEIATLTEIEPETVEG